MLFGQTKKKKKNADDNKVIEVDTVNLEDVMVSNKAYNFTKVSDFCEAFFACTSIATAIIASEL
jgi:hypothetical protein